MTTVTYPEPCENLHPLSGPICFLPHASRTKRRRHRERSPLTLFRGGYWRVNDWGYECSNRFWPPCGRNDVDPTRKRGSGHDVFFPTPPNVIDPILGGRHDKNKVSFSHSRVALCRRELNGTQETPGRQTRCYLARPTLPGPDRTSLKRLVPL